MGHDWEGNVGRVSISAKFSNSTDVAKARNGEIQDDAVRQMSALGIVDTGAAMCVIPQSMADQLGLPFNSDVTVRYADNRTEKRKIVDQLEVEIMGRRSAFRAVVEPNRTEPLIGVIGCHLDPLVPLPRLPALRDRAGSGSESRDGLTFAQEAASEQDSEPVIGDVAEPAP